MAARRVTRAEWLAARTPLITRLEAMQAQTTAAAVTTPLAALAEPGALRRAWPEVAPERRKAAVALVLEAVTVGPAVKGRNFFDPDRVSITWRA